MYDPGRRAATAMTYDEAIDFWYSRVNYEHSSPKPSDLNLDRMRSLLTLLGEPQRGLRIVHVAGSKGKGSTSAMLASVLRRAGYRTGLFTSPHLERVAERIQVDGEPISHSELAALMAQVRDAAARVDARAPGEQAVTFFEVATALGFLHFVRRRVDVAVVEVGLGGRFDSTNVCLPLVSIITSISFDHTQQLGNTLASIAREKAGIVKPGWPAISGARSEEARAVIADICRQRGAPLQELDRAFHYVHEPAHIASGAASLARVRVTTPRRTWPWLEVGLAGEHQSANAAVAVAAIEELQRQGMHIPDSAVADGLAGVAWPARLEVVSQAPLVILDCAHNLASARALLDTLAASFPPRQAGAARRFLIFASSRDKDLAGMLALLAPHFDHLYLTRFSNNPRGVPPETLAELLARSGTFPHTLCPSAAEAWRWARDAARPDDQICITGSVFLAGELRPIWRPTPLATGG